MAYGVSEIRPFVYTAWCESTLQVGTGLADGLQPHQVLCPLHHKEEEPLEVPYTINGVQLEHSVYVPVC